MPPTRIIMDGIVKGFVAFAIVAAFAAPQLQCYEEATPNNGRPIEWVNRSTTAESFLTTKRKQKGSYTEQTSELDDFAEAVQALNQVKELVVRRGPSFLELPIDGLLDVVNVCCVGC